MEWAEIIVKTTTEGVDIVAELFYEAGASGVVVEDPDMIRQAQDEARTWDYIDDSILENMEDEVLVKAYLNKDDFFLEKFERIRQKTQWLSEQNFGFDLGSLTVDLNYVKEEDWENNWKEYYKPVKVSDRIVIKPSWEAYEKQPGEIVLELDPGMAFGTGTHETTALCIDAVDRYLSKGGEVVDIGCGSGVLAISALLLGAEKAVAVDLDTNAVKATLENARRNHVEDKIEIIHGNLLDKVDGRFDMAIANIIADVIIDLSSYIGSYFKPGGLFIASGIILDRLEDVKEAVRKAGLELIEYNTRGEWAVVVCKANA
jgi:ribosomal protein L11 methyltransferase